MLPYLLPLAIIFQLFITYLVLISQFPDLIWFEYTVINIVIIIFSCLFYYISKEAWNHYHYKESKFLGRFTGAIASIALAIIFSIVLFLLYLTGVINYEASEHITKNHEFNIDKKLSIAEHDSMITSRAINELKRIKNNTIIFTKGVYYFESSSTSLSPNEKQLQLKITSTYIPLRWAGFMKYDMYIINTNAQEELEIYSRFVASEIGEGSEYQGLSELPVAIIQKILLKNYNYIINDLITSLKKDRERPLTIIPFIYSAILGAVGIDTNYMKPSPGISSYIDTTLRIIYFLIFIFLISPIKNDDVELKS